MEQRPNVAVLSGFGINCETETMAVFEMAGATSERVHINKLVNGELSISCLLYTSPSPRDVHLSRMPSSA